MLKDLFKRKEKKAEEKPAPASQPAAETTSAQAVAAEPPEKKKGWFSRLKDGLAKTRKNLTSQIAGLLRVGRRIDEALLGEIEEILIQADVGVHTTLKLMDDVRESVKAKGLQDSADLEGVLKEAIIKVLGQPDVHLRPEGHQPYVILILGINGAGKTTTIGKLAHRFNSQGKHVLVAAGDTFRAAAAEQLAVWCDRAGVDLVRGKEGSDPAAVVYDAVQSAISRKIDVLIIDTAGRLHTKKPLMDELSKIGRVIQKALPDAPHEVLLVLDGTAGQNAIMQAKIFNEAVPVTGVVVTKLDGTAKGGIVIAVKGEIGAPVKLIGIGERIDDLRDFVARDFVEALFEREDESEG